MVLATLFTGMGVATIVLLVVGLILISVEIFTPGFGGFGIVGAGCLVASIVTRFVLDGSDQPVAHFFLYLLFILLVISLGFAIMVILVKKGKLDNTFIIEKKSAVPVGITAGTSDFSFLVGTEGETITALRPAGIAVFGDKRYDVVTEGDFIAESSQIVVTKVEGVRIIVKTLLEKAE